MKANKMTQVACNVSFSSDSQVTGVNVCVCLSLTSQQQLRSYSDGTSVQDLCESWEARNRSHYPWFVSEVAHQLYQEASVSLKWFTDTETLEIILSNEQMEVLHRYIVIHSMVFHEKTWYFIFHIT